MATFELTSPAFEEGGMIPAKHTADGDDVSPPLTWSGVPEGVISFALICDDPDAPRGTWVHWVVWNIPGDVRALPEAVPSREVLDDGTRQGNNSWPTLGYRGPSPPSGTHRYYFKLYALDNGLPLPAGATKGVLLKAMEGHIVAEAQLMGQYAR